MFHNPGTESLSEAIKRRFPDKKLEPRIEEVRSQVSRPREISKEGVITFIGVKYNSEQYSLDFRRAIPNVLIKPQERKIMNRVRKKLGAYSTDDLFDELQKDGRFTQLMGESLNAGNRYFLMAKLERKIEFNYTEQEEITLKQELRNEVIGYKAQSMTELWREERPIIIIPGIASEEDMSLIKQWERDNSLYKLIEGFMLPVRVTRQKLIKRFGLTEDWELPIN